MAIIDKLGLGPKRTATKTENGWLVTVVPPAWVKCGAGANIVLTQDQYERYLDWQQKGVLIQDALPDLSDAQREILMTGMDADTFDSYIGKDDE